MNIEVSLVATLLAAISSMALGFFWYSPMWLGKPWMKAKGFNNQKLKSAQKGMGMMYGLSLVVTLITAYMLSHVMALSENFFHYPMLHTGLASAFWMWLGFVMPVQITATIFGDKNWTLFWIDTGYQLGSLLVMGVVLGVM